MERDPAPVGAVGAVVLVGAGLGRPGGPVPGGDDHHAAGAVQPAQPSAAVEKFAAGQRQLGRRIIDVVDHQQPRFVQRTQVTPHQVGQAAIAQLVAVRAEFHRERRHGRRHRRGRRDIDPPGPDRASTCPVGQGQSDRALADPTHPIQNVHPTVAGVGIGRIARGRGQVGREPGENVLATEQRADAVQPGDRRRDGDRRGELAGSGALALSIAPVIPVIAAVSDGAAARARVGTVFLVGRARAAQTHPGGRPVLEFGLVGHAAGAQHVGEQVRWLQAG